MTIYEHTTRTIRRAHPTSGRRLLAVGIGLLAVLALAGAGGVGAAAAPRPAPLLYEGAKNAIPGRYIVVFDAKAKRNVVAAAEERLQKLGGKIGFTYGAAIQGFSATVPANAMLELRSMPGVAWVEADRTVKLAGTVTQANSTWGLDRVDQRKLPLANGYRYSETGAGVDVYVIDSGIRATHDDLVGRVQPGMNFAPDVGSGTGGGTITPTMTSDCMGHGTHVAGTIGGTIFGVAKQVSLVPVRVFACYGDTLTSTIVVAVDWVTGEASTHPRPAVANMSLAGLADQGVVDAVSNSIAAGVTYAVAAGNDDQNACNYSPANVPAAITVGATDNTDTRAKFVFPKASNFGKCVDIFAPGKNIDSLAYPMDGAITVMSGTSMASPHVAGVAALYLQDHPKAAPGDVWAGISAVADSFPNNYGWPGIQDLQGSPNVLLNWFPKPQGAACGPYCAYTCPSNKPNCIGSGPITVPASSNLWLAGMPSGTVDVDDSAPAQSPVEVTGVKLTAGKTLQFLFVSGSLNLSSTYPGLFSTCDGHPWAGQANWGRYATNGISGLVAPANSLAGVFLGSGPASGSGGGRLDFGSSGQPRSFPTLSPALEQPFFIGDGLTGLTGNGTGALQSFVVPAGATRLFLGTVDSGPWYDNTGQCNVVVFAP